jgi:hypothetical protein
MAWRAPAQAARSFCRLIESRRVVRGGFSGSAVPAADTPRWRSRLALPSLVTPAFVLQMTLGLGLAAANYHHWNGYRQFAAELRPLAAGRRVWVNGEWGLRFYLEADGALPLRRPSPARGHVVVSSELAWPVGFTAPTAPLYAADRLPVPLRIIALDSSGFSSADKVLAFGVSTSAIDRVVPIWVERRASANTS